MRIGGSPDIGTRLGNFVIAAVQREDGRDLGRKMASVDAVGSAKPDVIDDGEAIGTRYCPILAAVSVVGSRRTGLARPPDAAGGEGSDLTWPAKEAVVPVDHGSQQESGLALSAYRPAHKPPVIPDTKESGTERGCWGLIESRGEDLGRHEPTQFLELRPGLASPIWDSLLIRRGGCIIALLSGCGPIPSTTGVEALSEPCCRAMPGIRSFRVPGWCSTAPFTSFRT